MKDPSESAPSLGATFLSVKQVNGNIYIVDQNGALVNGLISCSAHTSVNEGSTLELKAYSYSLDEKPE